MIFRKFIRASQGSSIDVLWARVINSPNNPSKQWQLWWVRPGCGCTSKHPGSTRHRSHGWSEKNDLMGDLKKNDLMGHLKNWSHGWSEKSIAWVIWKKMISWVIWKIDLMGDLKKINLMGDLKNWSHSLVVKLFECSSNIAITSFLSNDQSENHLANHIWPQGFYSNQILNCVISNSGGNIFCETHLATHIWEVGPTVAPGIACFHFWWQGVQTTPMMLMTVTKDDNNIFQACVWELLSL